MKLYIPKIRIQSTKNSTKNPHIKIFRIDCDIVKKTDNHYQYRRCVFQKIKKMRCSEVTLI